MISIISLLIAASSHLPLIAAKTPPCEKVEQIQVENGVQQVEQLSTAYEKGEYSDFLTQLDTNYQRERELGHFDDFLLSSQQERVAGDLEATTPEERDEFRERFFALFEERNNKLLEVCVGSKDLEICQVINRLANRAPFTEEEERGILYFRLLEEGAIKPTSPTEEQLFTVAEEYALKELMIDRMVFAEGMPMHEAQKKKFILQREKIDKMKAITTQNPDLEASKRISAAASAMDRFWANRIDLCYLRSLEQNLIFPQNETEVKVQEVMIEYSAKKNKLIDEYRKSS